MFYVKQSFGYADVITEIHPDNVFTRCPECGCEQPVDLVTVLNDEDADLLTTSIICADCTKKRMEGGHG